MEEVAPVVAILAVLVGLPWLILHYITKWKTSSSLTTDDEELLDDLHQVARKLEERLETVERLVAADNPDFRPESRPARRELPGTDASIEAAAPIYSRGTTQ